LLNIASTNIESGTSHVAAVICMIQRWITKSQICICCYMLN